MDAAAAAHAFIASHFPAAHTAFLAGSIVRGEATATSDLDIVVLTDEPGTPYRESFRAFNWPIEAFVHSEATLYEYFRRDIERRRPSLVQMCHEGQVLVDDQGLAAKINAEATSLLRKGPPPLLPDELLAMRYRVTDLLDDLAGSTRPDEDFFTALELATAAASLHLSAHGQWSGQGKWVLRALGRHDVEQTKRLSAAMHALFDRKDRQPLIDFAEALLNQVGGRLFEGYAAGKNA